MIWWRSSSLVKSDSHSSFFDHEQNLAKTITHLFMDYAVTIKQNQSLKKPFCCNKSAIIEWD